LKPKILVVEDNLASRELLMELLGNFPCEIMSANDGAAALETIRSFRPALVLLDIQLPVVDGLAVLQAVRADSALRGTRFIAVTAYAMQGDRERLLREGFDRYVCKPIDVAMLMNEVRKVLNAA
jgi:CheY-like chemotaxis protein